MNLSDIFPKTAIRDKFAKEVLMTCRGRGELSEISLLKPSCMFEMGAGAWDKYVQKNPKSDPKELASYFDESSPKLYLAMERLTNLKVLKDICHITADVQDEELAESQCAKLLIATTWPNVLRISDVTFADPYQPIPVQEKKYQFQNFKGLARISHEAPDEATHCLVGSS